MKIVFPQPERQQYYEMLNQIFDSGFWSEGEMLQQFETIFSDFVEIPSLAVNSCGAALYSLFTYADVKGHDVIIPANTFFATVASAKMAGANVIYADCNKNDLCLSLEDIRTKVTDKTKAVCVVHIGGHIAFQIEEIAAFCRENNIVLIEDCAHAHGATFRGKAAGSWGLGGAYSFYSTKTLPLGEGGMICSHSPDFFEWVKSFRNYGKSLSGLKNPYALDQGFNLRMNEMTAALGILQMKRLPEILAWKHSLAEKFDRVFERRVIFPPEMVSGFYKYIVFDYDLKHQTGQVYAKRDFGPQIEGCRYDLPQSDWIAEHHQCVPIWHGWEHADKPVEDLKRFLIN